MYCMRTPEPGRAEPGRMAWGRAEEALIIPHGEGAFQHNPPGATRRRRRWRHPGRSPFRSRVDCYDEPAGNAARPRSGPQGPVTPAVAGRLWSPGLPSTADCATPFQAFFPFEVLRMFPSSARIAGYDDELAQAIAHEARRQED